MARQETCPTDIRHRVLHQRMRLVMLLFFCIHVHMVRTGDAYCIYEFGAFLSFPKYSLLNHNVRMVPADTGVYLASGNTQTCTAQGFITAITLGASMSFYAVLMILCEYINLFLFNPCLFHFIEHI